MNWNRAHAVIAGLLVLGVAGLLFLPSPGPVVGTVLATFCAIGIVAGLRAARIPGNDVRTRRGWWVMTAMFGLQLLTTAAFAVPGANRTFPAPGDVLRALDIVVLFVAAYLFPVVTATSLERRKAVLDALTVLASGSMTVWYLVLGRTTHASFQILLAASAFPVLDLLLVLGFTRLVFRGTTALRRNTALLLTLAGLVQFIADAWFGYLTARTGSIEHDAVWQLVSVVVMVALLAAAVVERCRQPEITDPMAERCLTRGYLPYVAIAVGYSLMVAAAVQEHEAFPWSGLTLGGFAITLLVVLRQIAMQRESDQAATTDGLTGLANRSRLRDLLVQALDRDARAGRMTAVLLVDMNGFKQVNDTRGHKTGDQLLIGFARILRDAILGADVAGRLGGDEFAIVLHDIGSEANAEAVARRIAAAAEEPVAVDGAAIRASASIGIALAGPGEFTADELMHRADVAMYHAKRRGGDTRWASYAETMGGGDEPSLEDELRVAAGAGQLRLVFQPIVGLPDEDLAGVEALARWEHPRLGLLDAEAFIPLAERIGVIADIGRWVLREACSCARRWPQLPLHVNVSGRQLEEDGFSTEVREIVQATGMNPAQLVLEVTESQLIADGVPAAHLRILSDEGIRIALDDFGTGYSSLKNLTHLPIDMLKLDRVFVATLDASAEGAAVAQAVLRLGRVLGMDTVAEGVETAEQARELTLLGAGKAQGHYFARPLPPAEIDARIAAWSDHRYGRSVRA
ncbi:bifunctional diguanylate cyclase/phosphodiesterase [Actinoplanes sp. N902-109]|uniref:putative bifunctional diguanylate cyclase/phosphodiesterase n=1 Tax=Actinoplanes sp. (strain N902-109) TaxID=649831 RepID=UPI00032935F8|nr:bifunctional diguanylate cyclase/phosphodiesterase [Actinoplanes sp. N902-109]AGL14117.1 PAS/PAC and GAF sensor-containing diguanylate cyclase/phosphodiesterase [Actinoplanes sp. N902-109]